MTRKKGFKRLVRERMAHTGERYTQARRALLMENEFVDATGWEVTGEGGRGGFTPGVSHEGKPCLGLALEREGEASFASLVQTIDALDYRGRRVRFAAWTRCTPGSHSPTLGLGADGSDLTGRTARNYALVATEWRRIEVTLDIPEENSVIWFGLMLSGPGRVWMSGATFEVVDETSPVDTSYLSEYKASFLADSPRNLDFSEEGSLSAPCLVDWLRTRHE